MGCDCNNQPRPDPGAMQLYQGLSMIGGGSNENLAFFVQGVKVGMSIRAADQMKWTRLGIILAIGFGVISFMSRIK